MASLFIGLGVIFDIDFVLDSVMENGVKKYKHFSPHKHKMYIGINPDKVSKSIYKHYLSNGWYQGSYFIKNKNSKPLTKEEFKTIMNEIGNELGFFEKKERSDKYFTGETYIDLYPKMNETMEQIIKLLNERTPIKGWIYYEEGSIFKNLEILDSKV